MKAAGVFTVAAAVAAGILNAQPPAGLAGVRVLRDLAYVAGGHERQKLDLYLPEKAEGPLPLVIWVHGGAWKGGSKAGCPPARQGFTRRGYAVASVGYRLSGDALFPAQIEDCKAAVRWLRANAGTYGLDPERFGAWGSSAGGHLVALLGTSGGEKAFDVGAHLELTSRVQAVCDYYGPTDFIQMDARALPGAPFRHNGEMSPESALIGGPIQENREKAARANPVTYVAGAGPLPPFLIVHGDGDPLVPHHQSELLFDALAQAGATVRLHTIEGAGHGNGFGGREVGEMVEAFFTQWLKGAAGPGEKGKAVRTRSRAVN